jgi:hypothetical protein
MSEFNNVTGTNGSDTISETFVSGSVEGTLSAGDDRIVGEGGDDSIVGNAGADNISGGNGNDTLVAGSGDGQQLYGDGNDDILIGSTATNQTLSGGPGNDTLIAGNGIGHLLGGGSGNDSVLGSANSETLLGGTGIDSLSGGAGNDWMDFGDGNENFLRTAADTGNDTLIGGLGNNTLDLGTDWELINETGGYSLYRDGADTIYAQQWQVVCFAEGTSIVTPNGEDAVENLRAGDMVLAMRGGQAGFEPLRWVGFMDVAVPRDAAMAAKTAPVLIKAGALAPGMPARDLRVSPDHAMEVDGHLVPAKLLVNGSSIIQEVWCRRVRYFHLELEAHGLLLSEGAWSESYLDDGNRHAFNNASLTGLFMDVEAARSQGQYDHRACLPVLRQGLKLEEIQGQLLRRAEELAREEKPRRLA